MPGIVGIIGSGPPAARSAAVRRMTAKLAHEPFYVSDTLSQERLGVWAGWQVHRGSFSDALPIWNETRDICLLFCGEHFADHADETKALTVRGHHCGGTDARYLVHRYEEDGDGFFARLNGWFSGLLLDLRQGKVVLFNDRYGLGRLYYHEAPDGFYFASEAKALLALLPDLRRLDPAGLGEVFSCGCVLQGRSLFQGVSIVPGGARWTFHPGQPVQREAYFRRQEWESQPLLSAPEFYEQLKSTFSRILPRYFGGQEKIGISLTGGVDSRMVMAWARRPPGTSPCYTFGGPYRECVDVTVARKVARLCGQTHQVIPVGEEFYRQFPGLAEKTVYVTDGAMDVTGAADLYVNQVARGIAPVRMTGNYGGEILRSIVAFKPTPLRAGFMEPGLAAQLNVGAEIYRAELPGRRLSFVAFKQVPWHHYSRLSLELSQITLRSPYLDNELVGLAFRAPPDAALSSEPSLRLIDDGSRELSRLGTDRAVHYHGVPVLSQLLHGYQEFTFRAEYAYDYGMPSWLAKVDHRLAWLHLERLFLGRHKFHHFRIWYRDQLAGYLKQILLDPRALGRPCFDRRGLETMVLRHTRGEENYTRELHRALTCELTLRQLIDPA
jgi:asparagine synthase (glutamine-hydrolysing)